MVRCDCVVVQRLGTSDYLPRVRQQREQMTLDLPGFRDKKTGFICIVTHSSPRACSCSGDTFTSGLVKMIVGMNSYSRLHLVAQTFTLT